MSFAYNSSGEVFSATVASNAPSVTSDYHALGHSLGTTVWLPGGGRLSRAVGRSIFATDRVFSVANRFVSDSDVTNALAGFTYSHDGALRIPVYDHIGNVVAVVKVQ